MLSFTSSTRRRSVSPMGPVGPAEHRGSTTSGAPFTYSTQPPPGPG